MTKPFKAYLKYIFHKTLIFGCCISIASCATYYIPNTQNVPLLKEKNELQFSGGLAFGEQYSIGGDIQAAYSVTDHLALSANGYFGEVADGNAYRVGEIALGYFNKLGESKGIFEVYGGWGAGGTQWENDRLKELYHFNHFFIQPNIGGHLGAIDLAFSSRFNYAVWSTFEEFSIEPALTLRAGSDKIKFQI